MEHRTFNTARPTSGRLNARMEDVDLFNGASGAVFFAQHLGGGEEKAKGVEEKAKF